MESRVLILKSVNGYISLIGEIDYRSRGGILCHPALVDILCSNRVAVLRRFEPYRCDDLLIASESNIENDDYDKRQNRCDKRYELKQIDASCEIAIIHLDALRTLSQYERVGFMISVE